MATRSLIGLLEQDGSTYRARCCLVDGDPSNQLAQIGEALLGFYAADPTTLIVDILAHDWWLLSPTESNIEVTTGEAINPSRPPTVRPHAGIGYCFTDPAETTPIRGRLDEQPAVMIAWLYLFTAEGVVQVFRHDHNPERWASFNDYTVEALKSLALAQVADLPESER